MTGKSKKKLSRREFLKASKAVGLGTFALTSGCASLDHLVSRKPSDDAGGNPNNCKDEVEAIYDFVVIGTGAGGGPLACRLALRGYTVALIEAGDDYVKSKKANTIDNYSIPALHPFAAEDPRMSWNIWVQHYADANQAAKDTINYQTIVPGQTKKGILYPRAATVGGCTAHNAMITLAPDAKDWDDIAALVKDDTWSAKNMRSYFRKMENCSYLDPITSPDEDQTHGWGQPNPVTGEIKDPLTHWLTTEMSSFGVAYSDVALREVLRGAISRRNTLLPLLGRDASPFDSLNLSRDLTRYLDQILDPNRKDFFMKNGTFGRRADGVYLMPKSTKKGVRQGTREFINNTIAYCDSNCGKPQVGKLKLLTNHLAAKLVFSSDNVNGKRQVLGVECFVGASLYSADPRSNLPENKQRRDGQKVFIKAGREVIVSGGAFNSPQLLQLSGIGDPDHLGLQNIKVEVPLKGVGQNLQDRYEIGVVNKYDEKFKVLSSVKPEHLDDPGLKKYYESQKNGRYWEASYSSNGALLAFIQNLNRQNEFDPADVCIFGTPGAFKGYRPGYAEDAFRPDNFSWVILKGYAANQAGRVKVTSSSPFEQPDIQFNSFQNDPGNKDIDTLCKAVEFVRKMNTTPAMQDMQSGVRRANGSIAELVPGPSADNKKVLMKDEELKDWIKSHAWGHHASCTNKIGTDEDQMAVLDSNFKVKNINNLRVVDASSFPKIPGLYIVAPIYMISEKAADVIIQETEGKS